MILDEIVAYKREFVAASKAAVSPAELRARISDTPPPPPFASALARGEGEPLRVIAEAKKASPSKGLIRPDFDPVAIAADYAAHGAAAVSVLTDERFFQGALAYLRAVRRALPLLPLLRKDFVIDEYQILEAREAGASAVLLITSILDDAQLRGFREAAAALGLDALTEVHLEREAERAATAGAPVIGINNRDLRSFTVDLGQTGRVIASLGGRASGIVFVAESGISAPDDVAVMARAGADAILVGEHFMRHANPGEALAALMRRGGEPA